MKTQSPCPPPGSNPDPARSRVLEGLIQQFQALNFERPAILARQEALVDQLADWGTGPDDLAALWAEIRRWVRWWRLPSYHLAYLFQLLTQRLHSNVHVLACLAYSEAQASAGDGLAFHSLENAWLAAQRLNAAGVGGLEAIENMLAARLRRWRSFYYSALRPASYMDLNPLVCHEYQFVAEWDLMAAFPELAEPLRQRDPAAFRQIIESGDDLATLYYRVVALRFLGLHYESLGDWASAQKQHELGLALALPVRMETELGHLHRHCAFAQMHLGNLDDATQHLNAALSHEQMPDFGYWYAITAMTFGDACLSQAGTDAGPAGEGRAQRALDLERDRPALERALKAYRAGRNRFEVTLDVPAPVVRAVRQQLLRSFHDNALHVAQALGNPEEMLAEIEAGGPREATEVVAEIQACRSAGAAVREFRTRRALFAAGLSSVAGDFDQYLAALPETNERRQTYMRSYVALGRPLAEAQLSGPVAQQVLQLSLPGTLLLLFNLGWNDGSVTLFDAERARPLASARAPLAHDELEKIHTRFRQGVAAAETSTMQRAPLFRAALEALLADYQKIFGGLLDACLPVLRDRRVIIFPRAQLHAVPFHALQAGGKYLAEHCTVSYCPTLGLFLRARQQGLAAPSPRRLLKVQSGKDLRLYEGVAAHDILREPTLETVLETLGSARPTDLLFACHGSYAPDKPGESRLQFGGPQGTTFWRLFSELELTDCRSVLLGACESGLARCEADAEYVGLPAAFHSAGARFVLGSLWKVNQLATVILLDRCLQAMTDAPDCLPAALKQAQLALMAMNRDNVVAWINTRLAALSAPLRDALCAGVREMEPQPYARPEWWSGFYVSGA